MPTIRRLRRSELPVDTTELARYLIGKALVRDLPGGRIAGRIVETEAYVIGDAAAHHFRGMTLRNQSMFLERGHAYVYFIYGTWFCMNVAAEKKDIGGGVLLRALEPLEGMDLMRARRPAAPEHRLASGPGCLAAALDIDRRCDGLDLCASSELWLAAAGKQTGPVVIGTSVRIGLTKEAHRLLRFYERGNPCVSGPKRMRV